MDDVDNDKEDNNVVFTAIKCKLNSILKQPTMFPIIQKRVKIINEVWTEAYMLFNLHILRLLRDGHDIKFDKTTLERTALFVLNKQSIIRGKRKPKPVEEQVDDTINHSKEEQRNSKKKKEKVFFDDLDELTKTYNDVYLKIKTKNDLTKYNTIKSIKRPIEHCATQLLTNIKNHCNIHFFKYQGIYLKSIVFEELLKLPDKLPKKAMMSIVRCIQYHINSKCDNITIRSKHIKELDKDLLVKIIDIMKTIINKEKIKIPENIQCKVSERNLSKHYGSVIKYYYTMLTCLDKEYTKRFPLLPQLDLKLVSLRFDSRFISTIYDEWIGNILDESKTSSLQTIKTKYNIDYNPIKVGIKEFEKKYKLYYTRCFTFKEKFKYNPIEYDPISIYTNGYTVSVLFRTNKKPSALTITGNLEEHCKKQNGQEKKFKKGLFEVDDCCATNEFLDKFHKIGIDPNNKDMLVCRSETGEKMVITKSYYLEKSHIRQNTRKIKKHIKNDIVSEHNNLTMQNIYDLMTETNYKKSVNIINYIKFVEIYRKYWDQIWGFYGRTDVIKLEFDTYVNKKKAIHNIVRKIVPKHNKPIQFPKYNNSHIDNDKVREVKNKPIMVFFGKGNGKTTISNLKNSTPKGPISAITKELGCYCLTGCTDEYNTSQYCSECKEGKLEHPIETVIIKRRFKNKNGEHEIRDVKVKREIYKICYCKHSSHLKEKASVSNASGEFLGHHIIWNRDYNSSGGILHVGISKLTKKDLGVFTRKITTEKTIRVPLGVQGKVEEPTPQISKATKIPKVSKITTTKKQKKIIVKNSIKTVSKKKSIKDNPNVIKNNKVVIL